jgi:hypothetical protein
MKTMSCHRRDFVLLFPKAFRDEVNVMQTFFSWLRAATIQGELPLVHTARKDAVLESFSF